MVYFRRKRPFNQVNIALSRPLLTYVNNASIRNKMNVANYVEFMIQHVGNLAEEVGYVKLRKEKYNEQLRMLTEIKR